MVSMLIPHQKLTPEPKDIFIGILKNFFGNGYDIKKYIPCKDVFWVGSGRVALKIILNVLNSKSVGLPAFTCNVVLDSIPKKAKLVFIDSGVITFPEEIENVIENIDTLIVPYNFGFVCDIEKIKKICSKNNVILIEDCAQALGAKYRNNLVGSFGDFSFYSFGISKNIGHCGGLLCANKFNNQIKKEIKLLNSFPKTKLLKIYIESIISKLFFSPFVFKYSYKFFEKILKKENLDYKFPNFSKQMIFQQFKRYDRMFGLRKDNGKYIMQELDDVIDFIKPLRNTEPAWLYFTLLVKEREKFIKYMLKNKIDIRPAYTFTDLSSGECKKSLNAENKHLIFALYRPKWEVEYFIRKTKEIVNKYNIK